MKKHILETGGLKLPVYSLDTAVVGSGAAGYNAADWLYSFGRRDIAVITEGRNMGTSRNTGSDKQTYYKLTLAGNAPDSVAAMAKTLFDGGSMHGDIAMVEAALSARSFYKLVNIGVPFPHNSRGEYVGYKTDHDPAQRATSAGPLTSKFMTEKLEEQVMAKGIPMFDGYLVIGVLTRQGPEGETSAVGLIAIDTENMDGPEMGLTLFNCANIIYATGGPAGMYLTSVYPESHTGSSGIAFEAGVRGINLTESQYGIASTKFRWNLSGTYQQVIPRYISTREDGSDEKEFLEEYFENPGQMLDAIFLKGYQWPFDPRKIEGYGSSLIDILVYNEIQVKGRRVFMDFMHNPAGSLRGGDFDFSLLSQESCLYLKNSGALLKTPYDRLEKMNQPAIQLYRDHGIDLKTEYLEIAVCAQHNNGGLAGNLWWESNIRHFFPVGEANGTFGIYRPGGSALNSTQTGSLRAAQYISAKYSDAPLSMEDFCQAVATQVEDRIRMTRNLISGCGKGSNVLEFRARAQSRMTASGAHIRSLEACERAIRECLDDLAAFETKTQLACRLELPHAFRNRDILLSQYVYLCSIRDYIRSGGKSRGSYLVSLPGGRLPMDRLGDLFRYELDDGSFFDKVFYTWLEPSPEGLVCKTAWERVRPLPEGEDWFENVWNAYRRGEVIE